MAKVLEVKRERTIYGPEADFASLEIEGDVLHLSRYDDEKEWLVDAYFKNGWMPHFVHGFGSRCCAKRTVKPEYVVLIENAKAENLKKD